RGIDLEAVLARLGLVVRALVQVRRVGVGGRIELEVVDLAGGLGDAPAREAADDLLVVDGQLEREVQGLAPLVEEAVEDLGLLGVAGVAVQEEALPGVVLGETVGDHLVGDLVGHEVTGVHVAFRLQSERRAARDVGAEDVPGGDLGYAELLGDDLRLGSLPGPGRAYQYQSQVCSSVMFRGTARASAGSPRSV